LPESFPQVTETTPAKVLMVCLGNICRSPTLQIVLATYAKARKLNIIPHSAGTANYHVGEGAHPPTIKYGRKRGYDLSEHRARQFVANDFYNYDLIIAADKSNYKNIMAKCPVDGNKDKVRMATDFLPANTRFTGLDYVPDPWGGEADDYYTVVDLSEETMGVLCDRIEALAKKESTSQQNQ